MKKILMVAITSIALFSCSKEDVITPSGTTTQTSGNKRTTSVQCIGKTQTGSQCKNSTLSLNSKCYLHGGN